MLPFTFPFSFPLIIYPYSNLESVDQRAGLVPQGNNLVVGNAYSNFLRNINFQNQKPKSTSIQADSLKKDEGQEREIPEQRKSKIVTDKGSPSNQQHKIGYNRKDKQMKKRPTTYKTEKTEYLNKKLRHRGQNDQRILRNRSQKQTRKPIKNQLKKNQISNKKETYYKTSYQKKSIKKTKFIKKQQQRTLDILSFQIVDDPKLQLGKPSFNKILKEKRRKLLDRKFQIINQKKY